MRPTGSTAHPKPINWSHARIFDWGKEPRKHPRLSLSAISDCILFLVRSDNDTKGAIMGWHGIPMFHGMGSFMCWAAVCAFIPV